MSAINSGFANEFNTLYKKKVMRVVASMESKYRDLYSFVFDEDAEEFRDGETEAKLYIILKEQRRKEAYSLRFKFIGFADSRRVKILGINYNFIERGIAEREILFEGGIDEFQDLDLESLFVKRAKPYV
jgi:hypothetical protein